MPKTLVWITSPEELSPHLLKLVHLDYDCLPGECWPPTLWLGFFARRKALALLDEGAFVLFSYAMDEAEVIKIGVLESHRRQGRAQGLMQAAQCWLLDRGVKKIYLEVRGSNLPAQALYRHLGFEQVGLRPKYYHHPPEDALVFSLENSCKPF